MYRPRTRDVRRFTVFEPDVSPRSEDTRDWGRSFHITGVVKPLNTIQNTSQLRPAEWGQVDHDTLNLFCYDTEAPLERGQGVCVGGGEFPDYEIVGMEKWSGHTRLFINLIQPARRGTDRLYGESLW